MTPEQMSAQERLFTAHHEAGHAVVGCVYSPELRKRLKEVYITNDVAEDTNPFLARLSLTRKNRHKWGGLANFAHPEEHLLDEGKATRNDLMDREPKEIVYAYCVQVAAGQIAEARLNECIDPEDIQGDESDLETWAVTYDVRASVEAIDQLLVKIRAEAEELVKNNEDTITQVADALLATSYELDSSGQRRHILSGDKVREIIDGYAT